jgi:DMSO/TMAO reductase YedYZ molybdopterin-dependent catalytic subunit
MTDATPTHATPTAYDRPRVSTTEPRNAETELERLDAPMTSAADFFIRSHFPVPSLATADHRVTVDGLVERTLSLGVAELRAMGIEERTITIECAGNGRAHLSPPVHGVQWIGGAVGNGRWSGVPLGRILDAAGVRPEGRAVLVAGADTGVVTGADGERRTVRFERSLPLEKAKRDEVLLALDLDGAPLSAEHGGPVRALVGGWYGMASVKWVTHLTVIDGRHDGHWETVEYASAGLGGGSRVPITAMQPKAQITSPPPGAVVAGPAVQVRGLAWAGEAAVAVVEISDDDGSSWAPGSLVDESRPFAWTRWTFDWSPRVVGATALLARCRDDRGRTQPVERDPERGTYVINELVPYPVIVRG